MFEAHLDRWVSDVANQREHGTIGVAPAERFAAQAGALRLLAGRTPFGQLRDLVRNVQTDWQSTSTRTATPCLASDRRGRSGRGTGCLVLPLDLPVRPGMLDLREPVLDTVFAADPIKNMGEVVDIAGAIGELDPVDRDWPR